MDYDKDLDKAGGAGAAKIHKIRITLTSRNVKPLEKCQLPLHSPPYQWDKDERES